eukprot:8137430-Pyramimonas_sp.AAC.1
MAGCPPCHWRPGNTNRHPTYHAAPGSSPKMLPSQRPQRLSGERARPADCKLTLAHSRQPEAIGGWRI